MKALSDIPFTREDFDSIVDPALPQEARYAAFCRSFVLTDEGTLKYIGSSKSSVTHTTKLSLKLPSYRYVPDA